VIQEIETCLTEDWLYESRWELQPDGAVRILPNVWETKLLFFDDSGNYDYIDILPTRGSCEATTLRGTQQWEATLVRGHWCIGPYKPETDSCDLEQYCGEDPPVCD
jgi:hypothetical protein